MNEYVLHNSTDFDDKGSQFAFSAIKAAMALPSARVDRESFLTEQLRVHYTVQQVRDAIDSNPAHAFIPGDQIDKIADRVIKSHVIKAAAVSFGAGIPGGLAMAITIPADTVQFVRHAIVLSQKLAYLYGWPDLLTDGDPDEETQYRMVLLMGSMLGIGEANRVLTEIAKRFAKEVGDRLPRYALTKTAYYPIIKQVAKWIGIKVTKKSFAGGISKVIPLVGGGMAAAVTTVALRRMARKLKNHLRELAYAEAPIE